MATPDTKASTPASPLDAHQPSAEIVNQKSGIPPSAWVMTTNFAEGLPYMIVRILSTVFFTDIGVKERYLGYLNFLAIPWNFKFLWSPFVDLFGTKRIWLVILQTLIAIFTMLIALTCYSMPAEGDPTRYLLFISIIFVGMAFLAATNDIAIDAYYLEGLTDKGDQAKFSGLRVMAYRFSLIFARSGLVYFAALMSQRLGGDSKNIKILSIGWAYAFGVGALTMLLLSIFHYFWLANYASTRVAGSAVDKLKSFGQAFTSYLQQERVAIILIFIIIYKVGDEVLFSMVTPFLMRELGISKPQYAWLAGVVGATGTIVGAMLGGWMIKRQGLKKAIWPLTLMMNLNIWAYIWLAWAKPAPQTLGGISLIAFVHGYEQFAAGLGGAALTVFIMRTCNPDFRAAHYAIGSAIMTIPGALLGGFGGWIVEKMGYLNLFIIAFFASIPSMILLFWVPISEDQPETKK